MIREKIYRLVFDEDHELHGFTVQLRACSLADMFDMIEVIHGGTPDWAVDETVVDEQVDERGAKTERTRVVRPAFLMAFEWTLDLLGDHLVAWDFELPPMGENLEVFAVPPTRVGVRQLDREAVLLIREAWATALKTVNRPLPKPSSSGPPSVPALPTAMVPLSVSQAS